MSNSFQTLQVYNKNLTFLMKIGQSNPNEPFYFPHDVDRVQVCENYYVFRDKSEIILLDKSTGWIKNKFGIDERNDFLLDSATNRILTHNKESNQVVCYGFDGKSQTFDVDVSNLNQSIQLVDCSNDKLLFLDSSSKSLFNFEIKSGSMWEKLDFGSGTKIVLISLLVIPFLGFFLRKKINQQDCQMVPNSLFYLYNN